jgi:thiosulfate dehydrogenase
MGANIVLPDREAEEMLQSQLIRSGRLLYYLLFSIIVIVTVLAMTTNRKSKFAENEDRGNSIKKESFVWEAPDTSELSAEKNGGLIRYGRELIANTSFYLGPAGKVAAITNGMNCQNCHLNAGIKIWGNNYSAVYSTYPRFRERSGTIENIYKRVNDCLERSLNGRTLDTSGREMQAIAAYIKWLGQNVPKNVKPEGAGINELSFMDRPADPARGQEIYRQKCRRCHGADGSGVINVDSAKYTYPPLWGESSYTTGAGLFRVSRFAGYVKDNMPFGASHREQQLTDDEAWDVAAFVNSQPRPQKDFNKDWPNVAGKPVDHPFGPYADSFSERQHKYGPYGPIKQAREKIHAKKKTL